LLGRRRRRLPLGALVAGLLGGLVALTPAARAQLVTPNQGPNQKLPPALQLSLQQALELGLRQSINLRNGELVVQENQALLGLARTRFLPTIDLVALGSYAQVGSSVGFISNLPTIGDLNLQLGSNGYAVVQNTFVNVGLALNYSLLDFSRGPLRQSAKAGLQASEAEQLEQRRRSRFEIVSAYLNAQLAGALVPVWQQSLRVSSQLRHDAWAIRNRGLAARIDTLQADALVQSDRQGLVEAEAQRQISLSGLARALNLPPEQGIEVQDPLVPGGAWPLDLQASLRQSLRQRPALEALQLQRQAQLARVQLARASRLPTVGLLLGGGINGNWLNLPVLNATQQLDVNGKSLSLANQSGSASSSGSFYDWGALLSLRQPLFDGGLSRESTALAQRRAEQSGLAIENAQQLIAQSVQTWHATHRASLEQMRAAQAATQAGEEAVRDALLRYRAGIAPITELLIAQRNLQVARSARATAIHRWNLSRAGLELETGIEGGAASRDN
jgi:outer membrane protein